MLTQLNQSPPFLTQFNKIVGSDMNKNSQGDSLMLSHQLIWEQQPGAG